MIFNGFVILINHEISLQLTFFHEIDLKLTHLIRNHQHCYENNFSLQDMYLVPTKHVKEIVKMT